MQAVSVFYGSCPTCGGSVCAEVQGDPHVMLGPTITLVCQRHVPVSDVTASTELMMVAADRKAWKRWREENKDA